MNAKQPPQLPDNAPFTTEQRAWLNGYIAAVASGAGEAPAAQESASTPESSALNGETETYPWHDPSISLKDRLALAEGRPLELRLMAALAQEDCGVCGYDCKGYAAALASDKEDDLGKCAPGGAETRKALKELMAANG